MVANNLASRAANVAKSAASSAISPHYRGQQNQVRQSGSSSGQGAYYFPLERSDAYPAYIHFQPYKVDAYEVDASAAKKLFENSIINDVYQAAKATAADFTGTSDELAEQQARARLSQAEDDYAAASGTQGAMAEKAKQEKEQKAAAVASANREMSPKTIQGKRDVLTDLKAYRDTTRPSFVFYLPPGLQYNDQVTYSDADLGAGGQTALGGLNEGAGIINSIGRGISEGFKNMAAIFDEGRGDLAARLAATRLINAFPGSGGIQAAGSIAFQTGLNPGTRVLFDKPNYRQFAFSFKLIPTSPQEADHIQAMIKELRYEMYPEEIDIGGIPIGYKFPNVFRVDMGFKGGDIKVPRLQYCYLRAVDATYNSGTSGVFFRDGHPTEIDLTLSFMEYRPLTKRDVQAGF